MGSKGKWRHKLSENLTVVATEMSSWILKDRKWNYQLSDFGKMPMNSLGRSYFEYMINNKISYKPNLVRHDIKHILLGYEMKMPDEIRLHTYMIGNRSYNLLGSLYLLLCLLILPEQIRKLRADYRRGQSSTRLNAVDLRPYLPLDLCDCRAKLKIRSWKQ